MTRSWTAIDSVTLDPVDLGGLERPVLETMHAAGCEIRECYRVLKKGDANIVSELLRTADDFYELDHYPDGDVYDQETASQYYYHAHRGMPGEHGHFHTFVRQAAMPAGMHPVPYDGDTEWPHDDPHTHLVAISMDRYGFPIGLFATNRWVTGECWYAAPDVIGVLDRFEIDHAVPSWPANRWITAMFSLFRPEAGALLAHRDRVVAQWARAHPEVDVYEDRDLDVTGWLRVSVNRTMERIDSLLG